MFLLETKSVIANEKLLRFKLLQKTWPVGKISNHKKFIVKPKIKSRTAAVDAKMFKEIIKNKKLNPYRCIQRTYRKQRNFYYIIIMIYLL